MSVTQDYKTAQVVVANGGRNVSGLHFAASSTEEIFSYCHLHIAEGKECVVSITSDAGVAVRHFGAKQ